MPLVSQQGSVGDRLRNFFRISGRINTTVDEVVVPTAVLANLGEPPWRSKDRDFAGVSALAAVPAVQAFAGIEMGFGAPGVAVVERVVLTNATGVNTTLSIFFVADAESFGSWVGGNFVLNVENLNPGTAGALFARLPPRLATFSTTPAPGIEIARVKLLAETSLVVPVRVSLRGDGYGSGRVSQGLFAGNSAVNLAAVGSFSGTYYPEAL